MNRVIYVSIYPLNAQLERHLFLKELMEAGVEIEFWCLRNIFLKHFTFQDVLDRSFVRGISSFYELFKLLSKADKGRTLFVLQINLDWPTLWPYFLFTCFGCRSAFFDLLPRQEKHVRSRFAEKMAQKDSLISFFKGGLNVLARSCMKWHLVKPYDFVFLVGESQESMFRKRSKIVHINYYDYEKYRVVSNNKDRLIKGDYCVFLDEGTTHNEDIKIGGIPQLDQDKFDHSLDRFFKEIENRYGCPVVIAGHPGIKYGKNDFSGREVFAGKTCELVKDCKFVVSQSSMSVSFAVLFRKPIFFIYTNEYSLKRKPNQEMIDNFSQCLGSNKFNIDSMSFSSLPDIPEVDNLLYDSHKYRYLTSKESENEGSGGIVLKTLREFEPG